MLTKTLNKDGRNMLGSLQDDMFDPNWHPKERSFFLTTRGKQRQIPKYGSITMKAKRSLHLRDPNLSQNEMGAELNEISGNHNHGSEREGSFF